MSRRPLKRMDEVRRLVEFFRAIVGPERGFRFRDWHDYKSR